MSFDINELQLDDTPIEGLAEAAENWAEQPEFPPAIKPGKHQAAITVQEAQVVDSVIKLVLDLECKGGDEDGERLTFQRVSSKMFQKRDGSYTSQLLDMIMSRGLEGTPKSNKDLMEMVKHIQDTAKLVNFQSDLGTWCKNCASVAMLDVTGAQTEEEAKATLTAMEPEAYKAAYKEIRTKAEKNRNHRSIPLGPNGRHVDEVECKDCGATLRVNANISRWLRPSTGTTGVI